MKPSLPRPGVHNDQTGHGNRTSTSLPPSVKESGLADQKKRDSSRGRDRTVVGKLSSALGLEEDPKDAEWKEFKKGKSCDTVTCDPPVLIARILGTYNWPVSFVIPPNSPPSIRCDYGSVVYSIRAQVSRVGTFTSKLVANNEVTVISCPGADNLEESESIIVEREWDNHLRYLISLSGKSFPLGGAMPLQLTLMPMSKIFIYRLSVVLEEKGLSFVRRLDCPVAERPSFLFSRLLRPWRKDGSTRARKAMGSFEYQTARQIHPIVANLL